MRGCDLFNSYDNSSGFLRLSSAESNAHLKAFSQAKANQYEENATPQDRRLRGGNGATTGVDWLAGLDFEIKVIALIPVQSKVCPTLYTEIRTALR